ncbi:MAG: RagB/SusD family nutrient uptake outer membrane protein [Prevotellaceae bacterium]|jgi:hypothetical protein|nr:RagB/SusD family nutrient uptake outer membrane protein [Prevotellaceae bacterium]
MKKNIYSILAAALLLVSSAACSDFLDKEVDLSMSEEQVFSNKDNTRGFLANIYTNLPDGFSGYTNGQFLGASRDCMTDNAVSYWDVHYYNSVLIDAYNATNHPFTGIFYNPNVTAIRKTNQFLKNARESVVGNAEAAGDDNHLYERNMAEARLLRALFHFELICWFGDCPIIAEDENGVPIIFDLGNPEAMNMSRTPAAEALQWVADQCDMVKDVLPFRYANETSNWGRVNGATAYALKSRALLYRASKLNNRSGDASLWSAAAQAARDFITKNSSQAYPYRLYSTGNPNNDYYECFVTNPTLNNEFILCRSVWLTREIELFLAPVGFSGTVNATGRVNPTQNFLNCYEMADGKTIEEAGAAYDPQNPFAGRDPRLEQTILHHGSTWGNVAAGEQRLIDITNGGENNDWQRLHGGTLTGYYTKKFLNNMPFEVPNVPTYSHAWPIFRYAEVLLNAAEALNEAGQSAEAMTYINQVRERVGMPPYSGLNQAQLRERIRNERRIELCFEDHRWHDARRWMIYEDQTAANETTKPYSQQYYHLYGAFIGAGGSITYGPAQTRNTLVFNSPKSYYLPLPDSEVKRAPNLKQNPGWELSASEETETETAK